MKFIIFFDAGFGKEYKVVEAKDSDDAQKRAYEEWREAAEDNADYGVMPYSKERAEQYDAQDETA